MEKKSVQTFNCFGVLDSVCQFGACLAAWLRRKHQKKSQMCQLGLTSLEFQNRYFFLLNYGMKPLIFMVTEFQSIDLWFSWAISAMASNSEANTDRTWLPSWS